MVFGTVHPYIFTHFMEMFLSLVFNIRCIHVCVDIVRKKRIGKCMSGATSAKSILRRREGVYNGLMF